MNTYSIKSLAESEGKIQVTKNDEAPIPAYLLGRNDVNRTKVIIFNQDS